MQKTYWDQLNEDYQFYTTTTLEMIAGFCLAQDNITGIFEASCGTGYFIKLLRDMGYRRGYTGSDYCDSFVDWAGQNNPGEIFDKTNLYEDLPYKDNAFDISVVHHGMDYVYPYRTAFHELKRISSKYVIITLWQQFSNKNRIGFNEDGGWNVNIYDKQEWYDEIKSAGYEIQADAEIMEYNERYDKMVYNHLFILKT